MIREEQIYILKEKKSTKENVAPGLCSDQFGNNITFPRPGSS